MAWENSHKNSVEIINNKKIKAKSPKSVKFLNEMPFLYLNASVA